MVGERALEYRFVLERTVAEGMLRRAATWLAPAVHEPESPVTYCRTLYVDSQDGVFLRTFSGEATASRVRVRQYAVASDRASAPRATAAVWLELKRTCGLERDKTRVEIGASAARALLAGQPVAPEERARIEAVPIFAEVAAGLAAGRFRPCLLTWYRRWAVGSAPLRITVDEGIAYCLPRAPGDPGEPAAPDAVIARDALAVLEVKQCGPTPAWLEGEIAALGRHLALRHSKFRAGMDALRQAEPTTPRNDREFGNAAGGT
jgi:hypothetical protein